jgi:flagellar biosynthesis protein FlhF
MLRLADSDAMIERGGVYALVGPTGVGKTTTVAKLAARCVVRFGAAKVALLTTDSYRIGGYDQLRIYARILGVNVHVVRDTADLCATLGELSGRHLVLIDTIGMSHRDRMVAEHAALLAGSARVKRLLLLQATTNTQTLNQVVTAYREHGIDGCIITKTDEAAGLAPALDAAIRHELALHYVTDGQRVPEDLQLPNRTALIEQALHVVGDESANLESGAPVHIPDNDCAATRFIGTPARAAEPAEAPAPKVMRPLGRHAQMRVVHG